MNDIAIRVEDLSKLYRIGGQEALDKTLRESLTNTFVKPFQRLKSAVRRQSSAIGGREETIWALKDISIEIKRGEAVGIIGRNGAGKTTLLKILTRITEPTEGRAGIWGRVGSLLEVGTGFHPELTGRENIYLYGAILGMKRQELDDKFDEIVAFAEVQKFIDTPLKRYSTGMQMRLAFAVAAHLDPEILLVDEVLAVGDLEFQKKCLNKMGDVVRGGLTVLFVSHQMNQIRRLCERVIWLDGGHIRMAGPTAEVVSAYEAEMSSGTWQEKGGRVDAPKTKARFLRWEVSEPRTQAPNVLEGTGSVTIKFVLEVSQPIRKGVHGVALKDNEGQLMWGNRFAELNLSPGIYEFVHVLPTLPLRPGPYSWLVSIRDTYKMIDEWYCIPELIVATNPLTHPKDEWAGFLNIPSSFAVRNGEGMVVKSDAHQDQSEGSQLVV